MTLIAWSAALSVGVKQCDDQHQVLVGMVNDLHDAMVEGKGHKVLGEIFDRLFEYTRTHFADEEALLARHGYPGLSHHAEQHRLLVARVNAFHQRFKAGKVLLSVELMAFLRDWLLNHIQREDAQYGTFLNSRGLR